MQQQDINQIQSEESDQTQQIMAEYSDAQLSQLVRQAQLQEMEAYSDNFWG
jgi:hypothetical protein